jgi:hypothetical protein
LLGGAIMILVEDEFDAQYIRHSTAFEIQQTKVLSMIEGSLNDISLPSLLQLLCIESEKEYKLVLTRNNDRGEVLTDHGYIVGSTYGILEGEDSLCELITWRQGQFSAERFHPEGEVPENLAVPFQATMEFTQDATFLTRQNVGLNSVISGSILFGSTSWKELVSRYPLDRESLSVLAWLREGRSMRLAMREFGLDLARATAILKSLVITKSVDVIRIGREEVEAASIDSSETVEPLKSRIITTGEQASAAAQLAREAAKSFENLPAINDESFVSTAYKADALPTPANQPAEGSYNVDRIANVSASTAAENLPGRSSVEARLRAKRAGASTLTRLPSVSAAQVTSDAIPVLPQPDASGVLPSEVPYGVTVHAASAAPPEKTGLMPVASTGEAAEAKKKTGLDALLRNAHKRNIEAAIEVAPEVKQRPVDSGGNRYVTRHTETAEIDALKVPIPHDDPRFTSRTAALPLVALDIERLLRATFAATQFGRASLGNPSLDPQRRQTVLDAEYGMSLLSSIDEATRSPASILASCKYCLNRGYITTTDQVLPLTVDLLLGRMEIDQYLLQRRRISGDQLHDLINIANQEGIKLTQLLVKGGFLTEGDIETLSREQKRFAFK